MSGKTDRGFRLSYRSSFDCVIDSPSTQRPPRRSRCLRRRVSRAAPVRNRLTRPRWREQCDGNPISMLAHILQRETGRSPLPGSCHRRLRSRTAWSRWSRRLLNSPGGFSLRSMPGTMRRGYRSQDESDAAGSPADQQPKAKALLNALHLPRRWISAPPTGDGTA